MLLSETRLRQIILEELEKAVGIRYKTNKLNFFLDTFRGIKQLRIPAWHLQDVYARRDPNAMAVVAFDGYKPIGIASIETSAYDSVFVDDNDYSVGVIDLYVVPSYRGQGIASQLFRRLEKVSGDWAFIGAGRQTAKMLEKAGYVNTDIELGGSEGFVYENPNHSG